jgi:glycosyltransferase involved in cell wall biosynthesis
MPRKLRVLFLIEDGSFLYDNRVRREALCLSRAGADVRVICPNAGDEPFYSEHEGIGIYRYRKPAFGAGLLGHIFEYVVSLTAHTFITLGIALRHGINVIHAANPPDLLWLVALPYRLFGVRYVFDHHDLVPELFRERFGEDRRLLLSVARFMERMSFRLASHVISTNESYRRVAMDRGGKRPEDVTVVRNGPDPADFMNIVPDTSISDLAPIVVGYLGNMNPQDGVDRILGVADLLINERKRDDIAFVMVGAGDSFDGLCAQRDSLGLHDRVVMTGRIPWADVLSTLSATDICVQPDPPGGLNDHSTMNKLMEYMMLGKAVVSYDLEESKVSGGDAVLYVSEDSVESLGNAIESLADDRQKIADMGRMGLARIESTLAWHYQAINLVNVYMKLFPQAGLTSLDGMSEDNE